MATIMKHGDYLAEIEFDPGIDLFFGCVINVSGPVTFYGKSVEELRKEFAKSIKVYLDVCRERGLEPEKPYAVASIFACHRSCTASSRRPLRAQGRV